MMALIFFGVVIAFSLMLTAIDKISSYEDSKDRSVWMDGDSVVVKPKDAKNVGGGFGTRLDQKTK